MDRALLLLRRQIDAVQVPGVIIDTLLGEGECDRRHFVLLLEHLDHRQPDVLVLMSTNHTHVKMIMSEMYDR